MKDDPVYKASVGAVRASRGGTETSSLPRSRAVSVSLARSLRWTDRPTDDMDIALCILAPFLWQEIRRKCHICRCQPLQSAIFYRLSARSPLSLPVPCSVAFRCQNCQPGSRFYLPGARIFLSLPPSLSPCDFFPWKKPPQLTQIHKRRRRRVGGGRKTEISGIRKAAAFNLFIKRIRFFSSSAPPLHPRPPRHALQTHPTEFAGDFGHALDRR